MSERVTVDELRSMAEQFVPSSRLVRLLLGAAETIDALQARVAELEAKPPSSPDTDEARAVLDGMDYSTARRTIEVLASALDAARAELAVVTSERAQTVWLAEQIQAECERLREQRDAAVDELSDDDRRSIGMDLCGVCGEAWVWPGEGYLDNGDAGKVCDACGGEGQ